MGEDEVSGVGAPAPHWARASRIAVQVLAATPLLLREQASGTRRTYEAAAARAGQPIAEPYGVMTSTEALKAAVRAGLGATVVSRLTVQDELAGGSLVEVPVTGINLSRELDAIWPAGRQSAGVTELVRLASSAFPGAPPPHGSPGLGGGPAPRGPPGLPCDEHEDRRHDHERPGQLHHDRVLPGLGPVRGGRRNDARRVVDGGTRPQAEGVRPETQHVTDGREQH